MSWATNAQALLEQIADLTKDGECINCNKDGSKANKNCDADHGPWDMPNDDAVDTLHNLISEARGIIAAQKKYEKQKAKRAK